MKASALPTFVLFFLLGFLGTKAFKPNLRRSVVKYDTSRKVPTDVIDNALGAAIMAPNHFMTEPWRFYLLGPETTEKVIGLNPDKRAMFEGVPHWMMVTCAASEYGDDGAITTKKGLEDHAATSCAIQNFMLALAEAEGEGVGSKWMTGALGIDGEKIMEVIGADKEAERFMGAVWFGYPAKPLEETKAPPRKKGLEGTLKSLP